MLCNQVVTVFQFSIKDEDVRKSTFWRQQSQQFKEKIFWLISIWFGLSFICYLDLEKGFLSKAHSTPDIQQSFCALTKAFYLKLVVC